LDALAALKVIRLSAPQENLPMGFQDAYELPENNLVPKVPDLDRLLQKEPDSAICTRFFPPPVPHFYQKDCSSH
jgi:hypothetical protein